MPRDTEYDRLAEYYASNAINLFIGEEVKHIVGDFGEIIPLAKPPTLHPRHNEIRKLWRTPVDTKKEEITEENPHPNSTLLDLCVFGAREENKYFACDALYHLRRELNLVTDYPVLIAIDDYNYFFGSSGFYDKDSKKYIPEMLPAKQLSLARRFNKREHGLINGVMIASTTTRKPQLEFRQEYSNRNVVDFPHYSHVEISKMIADMKDQDLLLNDWPQLTKDYIFQMTGGRGYILTDMLKWSINPDYVDSPILTHYHENNFFKLEEEIHNETNFNEDYEDIETELSDEDIDSEYNDDLSENESEDQESSDDEYYNKYNALEDDSDEQESEYDDDSDEINLSDIELDSDNDELEKDYDPDLTLDNPNNEINKPVPSFSDEEDNYPNNEISSHISDYVRKDPSLQGIDLSESVKKENPIEPVTKHPVVRELQKRDTELSEAYGILDSEYDSEYESQYDSEDYSNNDHDYNDKKHE
eukprot:TRINITY_DN5414_c0_g2_i1.p1 TRINITY_DN5414_c0_g2~~TRINITY_DN5414_c0_g2_i1.p1  ORF type:complete len:474 (-),score=183.33 TRINITY_DN5414_c0_g2_i1:160-1581(-)